ncbi:MAG: GNAT family N-acetyltransferase [Candidatus Dormibacteria bacterium]
MPLERENLSRMEFHPPEELHDDTVVLRRYRLTDGAAVKDAIAASLDSLRQWMPWAQSAPTDASVMAFLGPSVAQFGGAAAANYAITLRDSGLFVGGCGLMPRIGPGALEIGYWVHARYQRRGIASAASRLLTDAAFALPGVHRVEIHCDEGNIASAAVPRTLGFRLDRVVAAAADSPASTGCHMVWIADRPA